MGMKNEDLMEYDMGHANQQKMIVMIVGSENGGFATDL
jgi:hypothetical protein